MAFLLEGHHITHILILQMLIFFEIDIWDYSMDNSNYSWIKTKIFFLLLDIKNLFCNVTSNQSKIFEVKDLYQWFNLVPFSMNKNGVISDHLHLL